MQHHEREYSYSSQPQWDRTRATWGVQTWFPGALAVFSCRALMKSMSRQKYFVCAGGSESVLSLLYFACRSHCAVGHCHARNRCYGGDDTWQQTQLRMRSCEVVQPATQLWTVNEADVPYFHNEGMHHVMPAYRLHFVARDTTTFARPDSHSDGNCNASRTV